MKIISDSQENGQAILQVEVEAEETAKSYAATIVRLGKKVAVPGFRPGKVPQAILENYVGKETLEREAMNSLIPQLCTQVLKDKQLEPIAPPEVEITTPKPLTLRITVSLRPTVRLGDYTSLRVLQEKAAVREEEIQKAVEQLAREQAPWEPVENPVQFGDLVTLEVLGRSETETILNHKGLQYEVRVDSPFPAPGFSQQIEGLSLGEGKEFVLPLPQNYPNPALRGKDASFQVKLMEIKRRQPLPLDDELARGLSLPDFPALREKVTTNLQSRAEARARQEWEDRALDALTSISTLDYPPLLVERETEQIIRERGENPAQDSTPELKEQLRPLAIRRVEHSLVLGELVQREKIEVTEQEVGAEVERLSQAAKDKEAELRRFFATPAARRSVQNHLIVRKAMDRLLALINQETPATSES